MAFLGHLDPLRLLRSVQSIGQLGTFWPNPMKPKGDKGGSHLAPKPQLSPPEPLFVTNSLDPKLAKNPMDTILAINPVGPFFWPWTTMDQYPSHGLWQPPGANRSAQSAFPSAYGEFFPFLHAIHT
ncbi:hypothetical protein O181_012881 [Austropuccinia psidii MF-1]|uniref:Uncharacterized protein n=1 Tax=Austropuccinia psidii MF-1 TaxID=1389203 RepID=A0A9Q3BYM5_9BASI|nr:hypothetical protein [Austropuccinia psidii MF-1]